MNEEYKNRLLKKIELLRASSEEIEKVIDLLKDSDMLDFDTRAKTTAFLEGYMIGLKEQTEWLNCFMWDLDTEGKE